MYGVRSAQHRLLHHTRGLHHLRQKHLCPLQTNRRPRPCHPSAALRSPAAGRPASTRASSRVDINVRVDALDERMREPVLDRPFTPPLVFSVAVVPVSPSCFFALKSTSRSVRSGRGGSAAHPRPATFSSGSISSIHLEYPRIDDAHVFIPAPIAWDSRKHVPSASPRGPCCFHGN